MKKDHSESTTNSNDITLISNTDHNDIIKKLKEINDWEPTLYFSILKKKDGTEHLQQLWYNKINGDAEYRRIPIDYEE